MQLPDASLAELDKDAPAMRNCGPACLYACLSLHGVDTSYQHVSDAIALSDRGCTMEDLHRASKAIGCPAEAVRCTYEELAPHLPAIVHLQMGLPTGHFVVLLGRDERDVYVLDGATCCVAPISRERFFEYWTGAAMIFRPASTAWKVNVVATALSVLALMVLCREIYLHWCLMRRPS
jgi:ABC-type bacteriocin/lantibiotic exporter with double-glycine peptidase domain